MSKLLQRVIAVDSPSCLLSSGVAQALDNVLLIYAMEFDETLSASDAITRGTGEAFMVLRVPKCLSIARQLIERNIGALPKSWRRLVVDWTGQDDAEVVLKEVLAQPGPHAKLGLALGGKIAEIILKLILTTVGEDGAFVGAMEKASNAFLFQRRSWATMREKAGRVEIEKLGPEYDRTGFEFAMTDSGYVWMFVGVPGIGKGSTRHPKWIRNAASNSR